jgi:hypothetical protein
MKNLNIQVFVDVIALLSGSSVDKSVFIYDDSPAGSVGKGTPSAVSAVYPGQFIQWSVYAIDVQTIVWVNSISFGPRVVGSLDPSSTLPEATGDTAEAAEGTNNAEQQPSTDDVDSHANVSIAPLEVVQTQPWLLRWEGYAPACMSPNVDYPYALHLKFKTGETIVIDGPKLAFPTIAEPAYTETNNVL